MIDDVNYLLSLREGENIELKESQNKIPLSFYESYCAMANGSGGKIYLGIIEGNPNNTICGVENAPQKKTQLCNSLTTKSKIANNIFSPNDISIINTEYGDVIQSLVSMGYDKRNCEYVILELTKVLNEQSEWKKLKPTEKEDMLFRKALIELAK